MYQPTYSNRKFFVWLMFRYKKTLILENDNESKIPISVWFSNNIIEYKTLPGNQFKETTWKLLFVLSLKIKELLKELTIEEP